MRKEVKRIILNPDFFVGFFWRSGIVAFEANGEDANEFEEKYRFPLLEYKIVYIW